MNVWPKLRLFYPQDNENTLKVTSSFMCLSVLGSFFKHACKTLLSFLSNNKTINNPTNAVYWSHTLIYYRNCFKLTPVIFLPFMPVAFALFL